MHHVRSSPPPSRRPSASLTEDEEHLARLGYKQELARSWSGFSNFAISFSIISILAGCLTTYGAGIANGGPVSISWSWPIISVFILIIGFTMSELVSAMPTSGGIYYWASKLGGPAAGFFTGWLNLIGLIAVTASVAYGCATFFHLTFLAWGWQDEFSLNAVFLFFLVILVFITVVNIFSSHLLAVINNISVWWHVAGAAFLVLVLIIVPDQHLSVSQVFTDTYNGSGWADGSTSSLVFFFAIIPFGFILTQYTITGFDASVHLSEETQGAAKTAAKAIWQSIFYSAVGGYILLLAVTFAIPQVDGVAGLRQHPGRRRRVRLRRGPRLDLGRAAALHLVLRAALLRHRLPDVDVADDVRLQPRPRRPRLALLVEGQRPAHAGQRGDLRGRPRRDHHAARAEVGQRHPDGVLRRHLGVGHRPLLLLRDPDLPALACRRLVRGRQLEQRQQVQVDEPRRRDRDRRRRLHADDAHVAVRCAVA